MKNDVILHAENLRKTYGVGQGKTVALDGVSLNIYEGEFLVILGGSGSGKSTLLNMIGGMDAPDEGSIMVDGKDLARMNDRERTAYRRDKIGFVFQSFNLIGELTTYENVVLTAHRSDRDGLTNEMLGLVGLGEKTRKYPSQLSGGEQQRVSIARALAKKPEILLCDEPTGALDYETGKQILSQLEELSKVHGKTVVMVTHTKEIGRIANRVVRVKDGQIVEEIINENPASVVEIDW